MVKKSCLILRNFDFLKYKIFYIELCKKSLFFRIISNLELFILTLTFIDINKYIYFNCVCWVFDPSTGKHNIFSHI